MPPPAAFTALTACAALFLLAAHDKQGNGRVVADLRDGASVEQVAKKPVAMSGHRNQITGFSFGDLDDFRRRIAERKLCFRRTSGAAEETRKWFTLPEAGAQARGCCGGRAVMRCPETDRQGSRGRACSWPRGRSLFSQPI